MFMVSGYEYTRQCKQDIASVKPTLLVVDLADLLYTLYYVIVNL